MRTGSIGGKRVPDRIDRHGRGLAAPAPHAARHRRRPPPARHPSDRRLRRCHPGERALLLRHRGVESARLGCQPCADIFAPSTTATSAAGQYSELLALAAADLARKGDGAAQEMASGNKRRRVDDERPSMLDDVLAAHAQQQTVAVDHILHTHARKMWAALADQRRSHLRLVVFVVEARAAKRLKAKDDEIERSGT
ncbi:hypothetical protein D1007_42936 [Hordeum vulgare]|nr:hypothetical protein D1007_42936 [Hordeum vulgare]